MKFSLPIGRTLPAIVSASLMISSVALAQSSTHAPGAAATPVRDAVLLDNGVLLGQLVDSTGRSTPSRDFEVRQNNRLVVTNRSAMDGRFAVSGLRPGVYQIMTPTNVTTVRLWTPELAPPVAESEVVVVHNGGAVASPLKRASWFRVLGNPWVMGGIAVGAVAIPVALAEDDDDASSLDAPDAS